MKDKCQDADWNLGALGALDEGTQREMEDHLRTECRACSSSYQEAVLVMDALAGTVPQHKPSPHIADALRSRIKQPVSRITPNKIPKTRLPLGLPWAVAAACALVAMLLGIRLEQANRSPLQQRASSAPTVVEQARKETIVVASAVN